MGRRCRKAAAARAKLDLPRTRPERPGKRAVALEHTTVEGQVACRGKPDSILRLKDAGGDSGRAAVGISAGEKPLAGAGLVHGKGRGAVVHELERDFVVPSGIAGEGERALAGTGEGHGTGVGKDERGVVLDAGGEVVVAVVAGGVDEAVPGEGEEAVGGHRRRLGELDEARVGPSILQRAAIEDQVGRIVGRGAKGAGAAAVGKRVDSERCTAAEDGCAGVSVETGQVLGAACAIADHGKYAATGIGEDTGKHRGGGRCRRGDGYRHGRCTGVIDAPRALQHSKQHGRQRGTADIQRARSARAVQVQQRALPDGGVIPRARNAEAGGGATEPQSTCVDRGVSGVAIRGRENQQAVTGLGERGSAGANWGIDVQSVCGVRSVHCGDQFRAGGSESRTRDSHGAVGVIKEQATRSERELAPERERSSACELERVGALSGRRRDASREQIVRGGRAARDWKKRVVGGGKGASGKGAREVDPVECHPAPEDAVDRRGAR